MGPGSDEYCMRIRNLPIIVLSFSADCMAETPLVRLSPETALDWIKAGNDRHMAGRYVHWHQSVERRRQVAASQRPHAAVLSCSDSQVPPEIVFDQGLGDLYVVRIAGNALADKELGSIEHAVSALGVPLVVVLGHQRCSAVEAALRGQPADGHFASVASALSAAVARGRSHYGDKVDHAIRWNITFAADRLRRSEPILAGLVRSGRVRVVEAYYSPDSGAVFWLESSGRDPAVAVLR